MSSPGTEFLERSRYYLAEEYIVKIRHSVAALPDGALWHRANDDSNSIGNLLAHLAGNIQQWVVEGIGGSNFSRDRAREFSRRDDGTAGKLLADLEAAVMDSDSVLARLSVEDLGRSCRIQGRDTTVLTAIYHVVEHFAMHTGQIVMIAKAHAPGAIRFYDDTDGRARPLWGGAERMI